MSAKVCCHDNAVVESFFATLKKLVYQTTWADRETASLAISEYIQVSYDGKRRHSTLATPPAAAETDRRQGVDAVAVVDIVDPDAPALLAGGTSRHRW